MGPISAALWVWPVPRLRQAFGAWVEGVIILCFWALFWNTSIFLLAAFKGVGDTGTVYCCALVFLCVQSVKSAFDFVSLVSSAASGAETMAKEAMGQLSSAMGGKGGVVHLGGIALNNPAIERLNGLKSALKDFPDITLLDAQPADRDTQKAKEIMAQFLTRYGYEITRLDAHL